MIGRCTWLRTQRVSSIISAGIGCSTNSTPCDSSQLILRTASSLFVQPSLASTRSGFFVTLRTAAMLASSVVRPTLILRTGNASASCTFCRVFSGVSMPMENVVIGVSAGSSPSNLYSGTFNCLPNPIHQCDIECRLAPQTGSASVARLRPSASRSARDRPSAEKGAMAAIAFFPSAAFS